MMHLDIIQNTGNSERVANEIVTKLYELAVNGQLDGTSSIEGTIEVTAAYAHLKEFLETLFPAFYINATSLYIRFEDSAVESALISAGASTDGEGITVTDAARFSPSNSNMFTNDSTITKFNEFKYFTLCTGRLGQPRLMFNGCTNLEEITLPSTTSYIYESMFNGCTNLKELVIPSNCSSTGNGFAGNSGIKRLDARYVTEIGWRIMENTPNCRLVNFNSLVTFTSYNQQPARFGSQGMRYFYLKSFPDLKNMWYFPTGTGNILVMYTKDVTTINYDFCSASGIRLNQIKHLVINNENAVPTLLTNSNSLTTFDLQPIGTGIVKTIWVPDSMLTAYRTAWGQYCATATVENYIKPLSEMTKVATEAALDAANEGRLDGDLVEALIEEYM